MSNSTTGTNVNTLLERLVDGQVTGLGVGPAATGFTPLDDVLDGGLLPGELVLLGGQPAVGKTLSALQWARNIAGQGRNVVFACFEHDEHSLLGRLISQEIPKIAPDLDVSSMISARDQVRNLILGLTTLDEVVTSQPLVKKALESLYDDAPSILLNRASTHKTTPRALNELCDRHLGAGDVLFVDYLQKVPIPGVTNLSDRIFNATEELKDLATSRDIIVVALASADATGIGADRLRLENLRGSDSLGHEADIAMILNQKSSATSENHTKFDLNMLQAAKQMVILSIEKNRRGESGLHMEFKKDFGNYRLNPTGNFVAEHLRGE